MSEAGPSPLTPRRSLQNFFEFVEREIPEGITGKENAYPITIGDSQLEAVVFGLDGDRVSFGLFVREGTYTPQETIAGISGKYSRKTLEISKSGEVTEDAVGVIPDFDLTDNEPDFSNLSNEEVALSVIKQIQTFKRPNSN